MSGVPLVSVVGAEDNIRRSRYTGPSLVKELTERVLRDTPIWTPPVTEGDPFNPVKFNDQSARLTNLEARTPGVIDEPLDREFGGSALGGLLAAVSTIVPAFRLTVMGPGRTFPDGARNTVPIAEPAPTEAGFLCPGSGAMSKA